MRICLTTFGSFGDLHPMLGLALELGGRGHHCVLATSPVYRDIVEREGIAFHAVRPDLSPNDREILRRVMDRRRGTEEIFAILMPSLRDSYADLYAASEGADLLVTHPVALAGPIVAEQRKVPWASTVLAPMSFFSEHDFPVIPPAPGVVHLTSRSRAFARLLGRASRAMTIGWVEPVRALRRELGLPPAAHPLFEGQHSPWLVLALFSRLLAAPQPDWPANVLITGAIRYDGATPAESLSPDLAAFLDGGDPPIVFTLGSAAVGAAEDFYEESARAAALTGRRAVLVIGRFPENRPRHPLPDDVLVIEYAPYSRLFSRAAAVVHQGGIGTLHQALAAGRPMIVVPFAHDQPDNAHRVERLGISRTIYPHAYRASVVARALSELLGDPATVDRARAMGEVVRLERGAESAADALELLARTKQDQA